MPDEIKVEPKTIFSGTEESIKKLMDALSSVVVLFKEINELDYDKELDDVISTLEDETISGLDDLYKTQPRYENQLNEMDSETELEGILADTTFKWYVSLVRNKDKIVDVPPGDNTFNDVLAELFDLIPNTSFITLSDEIKSKTTKSKTDQQKPTESLKKILRKIFSEGFVNHLIKIQHRPAARTAISSTANRTREIFGGTQQKITYNKKGEQILGKPEPTTGLLDDAATALEKMAEITRRKVIDNKLIKRRRQDKIKELQTKTREFNVAEVEKYE